MKRKILSIALSLTTVASLFTVPAVSAETASLASYRASDVFVADISKVQNGQWTSQYYNTSKNTYTNYSYLSTSALNAAQHDFPSGYSDDDMYKGLTISGGGAGFVTKYWMRGPGANNGGTNCTTYFSTRTFEAPETGTVSVYAIDADGSLGVHGSLYTSGTAKSKIKIMKNSEQVWPTNDGGQEIEPGAGNNLTISPVTLSVDEGDKLYFMLDASACRDTSAGGSTWDDIKRTAVYWDPVVAYTGVGTDADIYVPEKTENVSLDEIFTIPAKYVAEELDSSCIRIDGAGEPKVRSLTYNESGDMLLQFAELRGAEPYVVCIKPTADAEDSMCTFSFTTAESYQASSYFEADANKISNAPWASQKYVVSTGAYYDYAIIAADSEGTLISKLLNEANPAYYDFPSYYTDSTDVSLGYAHIESGSGSGIVTKFYMLPPGANTSTVKQCESNYTARTFVAPRDGVVNVAAIDADGTLGLRGINYSSGSADAKAKLKITKNSEQIWPSDNSSFEVTPNSGKIGFAPLYVDIKQGEALHFVLDGSASRYTDENSGAWADLRRMQTYWDPVVTYTDAKIITPDKTESVALNHVFTISSSDTESGLTKANVKITGAGNPLVNKLSYDDDGNMLVQFIGLRGNEAYAVEISGTNNSGVFNFTTAESYQASSYFEADASKISNGPWASQKYVVSQNAYYDYTTVTTKLLSEPINTEYYTFPEGEDTSDVTLGYAHAESGSGSGSVTKYWVKGPSANNGGTNCAGHYTTRTFTAPYDGMVDIAAIDADGTLGLHGTYYTAGDQSVKAKVKVMKGDEQIWPANNGVQEVTPGEGNKVEVTPITTHLSKGEQLHFVLDTSACPDTSAGGATWAALMRVMTYWDPIVTYTSGVNASDVTFADSTGAELTDFASIVSADTEVSVKITPYDADGQKITPIAAVYSQNGELVNAAIGETTTLASDEVTVKITLSKKDSVPESGYIKVFVFDEMTTMIPVADIGESIILGSGEL